MFLLKWFIYIIFGSFILIFALSNSTLTEVNLWPFTSEVKVALFLIIFAVFFLGMFFSAIIYYFQNMKLKMKIRKQNKIIKALENKISADEITDDITDLLESDE